MVAEPSTEYGAGGTAPSTEEVLCEIEALETKLAPWKELKGQLTEARRRLKILGKALLERLDTARKVLSAKDCRDLVLALARDALEAILRKYMDEHLQEIVSVLGNLWDKYAVALRTIEGARSKATHEIDRFLENLGYAT
jgi:hypothetical protein